MYLYMQYTHINIKPTDIIADPKMGRKLFRVCLSHIKKKLYIPDLFALVNMLSAASLFSKQQGSA